MKVKPLGFGGIPALMAGESMAGLAQRGKMDYSNGFGFAVLGKSRLGDPRLQGGIYQKRVRGYNQFTGPALGDNETYYVKMRSYAPTNPRTVPQQANRAKFADGMSAWALLTTEQKNAYNKRANRKGRLGRWLFMSEYLKNH